MDYEAIFCIVNAGYSDMVMDAAKEVGARGGTVIHARGTANKEAEKLFQITIQPDKDIVMILVPADIKDAVLRALYNNAGLKTAGQGIAFSMAVDSVVGISSPAPSANPEKAHEHEHKDKAEHRAEKAHAAEHTGNAEHTDAPEHSDGLSAPAETDGGEAK